MTVAFGLEEVEDFLEQAWHEQGGEEEAAFARGEAGLTAAVLQLAFGVAAAVFEPLVVMTEEALEGGDGDEHLTAWV